MPESGPRPLDTAPRRQKWLPPQGLQVGRPKGKQPFSYLPPPQVAPRLTLDLVISLDAKKMTILAVLLSS